MTIEKTNDESTIITSSNVSILGAAVDPCSPFQSGISMITELTIVSKITAAISFPIGTPHTDAILFRQPEAPGAGLVPQGTTGGSWPSSPREAAITVRATPSQLQSSSTRFASANPA